MRCTISIKTPMTRMSPVSTRSVLCTLIRSRLPTSITSIRPSPGRENSCSTTTAPINRPAICRPNMLTIDSPTPGNPLRSSACRRVYPKDIAVRTCSACNAEKVALRTKRKSTAPSTRPTVSAGRKSDRNAATGVVQPERGNPWEGSHPSQLENIKTTMRPAQTTGTAAASILSEVKVFVAAPCLRYAESTPRGSAITSAISKERNVSGSVTVDFCSISDADDVPEMRERPRSPVRKPPIQSKY